MFGLRFPTEFRLNHFPSTINKRKGVEVTLVMVIAINTLTPKSKVNHRKTKERRISMEKKKKHGGKEDKRRECAERMSSKKGWFYYGKIPLSHPFFLSLLHFSLSFIGCCQIMPHGAMEG